MPKLETRSDDTSFYVCRASSPLQGGPFNSQSQLFGENCKFRSKWLFFNVFRDSHFQSQLFGQMKRFLWIYNFWKSGKIRDSVRGRGFKCLGRLEKREKTQFREKVANLTLKCTFEGSKVLAGGGQTLENRKNLCHFTKPPFSALCEKWSFFWHKMTDAFYRKLDFRA